jgi:hypothetical protein
MQNYKELKNFKGFKVYQSLIVKGQYIVIDDKGKETLLHGKYSHIRYCIDGIYNHKQTEICKQQ